jgi:hypothetical protein
MRSPTASTPRATGDRGVRYARRPRLTLCSHDFQRTSRKLSVNAVALCALCPPLYCPGATRPRQACSQSSYLTFSGCQLLSQGRPGVRLARHQRRRQVLRRQHGISCGGNHCDDNDAQPDASAAATSTANTTMHNPDAFHTAGVTATCSTLARLSTRMQAKRSCSRLSPSLPSLSLPATYKFVPHLPTKRIALPGAGV